MVTTAPLSPRQFCPLCRATLCTPAPLPLLSAPAMGMKTLRGTVPHSAPCHCLRSGFLEAAVIPGIRWAAAQGKTAGNAKSCSSASKVS